MLEQKIFNRITKSLSIWLSISRLPDYLVDVPTEFQGQSSFKTICCLEMYTKCSKSFKTTKLFSIPEHAAVPQQEANTIFETAGSDTDTDSKKEIGTKIECSDSE